MIARHRGDERIHSRWRPGGARHAAAASGRPWSASMSARSMSSTELRQGDDDRRTATRRDDGGG